MDYHCVPSKKIVYFTLIFLLLGNTFQAKSVVGKIYPGMKALPFALNDLNEKRKTSPSTIPYYYTALFIALLAIAVTYYMT